jgi:branched-chain amino acid aminotransferase
VACPEGVTRATVLEICAANAISCEEKDLGLEEVYRAEEMFCTGTMGELAGVIKLDSRTIGAGEVGPITQQLSKLFAARTASEGEKVV